jgi:hypothetical protein
MIRHIQHLSTADEPLKPFKELQRLSTANDPLSILHG